MRSLDEGSYCAYVKHYCKYYKSCMTRSALNLESNGILVNSMVMHDFQYQQCFKFDQSYQTGALPTRTSHPVMVTTRDSMDHIRALLCCLYITITRSEGLLKH